VFLYEIKCHIDKSKGYKNKQGNKGE